MDSKSNEDEKSEKNQHNVNEIPKPSKKEEKDKEISRDLSSNLETSNKDNVYINDSTKNENEGKNKNKNKSPKKPIEKAKKKYSKKSKSNLGKEFVLDFISKYPGLKFPDFEFSNLNDVFKRNEGKEKPFILCLDDLEKDCTEFYKNTLCSASSLELIKQYFLSYFCNTSKGEGKDMVSFLNIADFPTIILFSPDDFTEPKAFAKYPSTASEFYKILENMIVHNYSTPYKFDKPSENEPPILDETALIRLENEEEFNKALKEDQRLVEEKLKEIKQKEIKEKAEKKAAEIVQEKIEKEQKEKEIRLKMKKENTPNEPSANNTNASEIIFRLPSGEKIIRRFPKDTKVLYLYFFLDSLDKKELEENKYKIVQINPPMEYNKNFTLEAEGLFPKALVYAIKI